MGPRNASVHVCCFNALFAVTLAISPIAHAQEPAEPPPPTAPSEAREGTIAGAAFDDATGFPLGNVTIVVRGRDERAITDFSGRFRLTNIPAGVHDVVFSREDHLDVIVSGVVVRDGALAEVSANLTKAGAGASTGDGVVTLEAVRVSADVINNSAIGLSAMRRRSPVSIDALSANEFSKFAATDVSEALIRIPGVTQSTKGSFAVIRGLSERYNATLLNGVPMPSSDPERQNIELDIFPTRLLDALVVYKNFGPDLPGNLTGGGIDIRTTSFPDEMVTTLTVGTSVDADAIAGEPFYTYDTGGDSHLWARGSRDRFVQPPADVTRLPPDANVPFVPHAKDTPIGAKLALFHGNTLRFRNGWELGYNLSFSYDSSYGNEEGVDGKGPLYMFDPKAGYAPVALVPGQLAEGYDYYESTEEVAIGALMHVALKFNPEHQLRFTAFTSQVGVDRVTLKDNYTGLYDRAPYSPDILDWDDSFTPADVVDRVAYELLYRERNLTSLALSGDHLLASLNGAKLDYTLARVTAYQDEPDFRRLLTVQFPREAQYYLGLGGADGFAPMQRFWRKTDETLDFGGLRWQQPLLDRDAFRLSFEAGGSVGHTIRDYDERFGFSGETVIVELPEQASTFLGTSLLAPARVILDRRISAAFTALTADFRNKFKLTVGARPERTTLTSDGFGFVPSANQTSSVLHYTDGRNYYQFFSDIPFDLTAQASKSNEALAQTNIDQTDWLPAVLFTWSPTKRWNVRAAWSRTIARPSLREVGNYYSQDQRGVYQHGNAFLKLSDVENIDLRIERFFKGTDLVALSAFSKTIERPIEKVGAAFPNSNTTTVETWINNTNTADLRGMEFEFRKGFGFLGAAFDGLSIGGNATWIEAEVAPNQFHVSRDDRTIYEKAPNYPKQKRPLFDQPEWIANGDVTYAVESWGSSATLALFASDRVLTTVNTGGVPDEFQAAYSRLDFTFSQVLWRGLRLKFSAKNLTDPERRFEIDEDITGDTDVLTRRWRDGRSYSLTLSYDF